MSIISSIIFSWPGDNGDGNHLTPSGDGAGPAHSNLFLYSVSDYLSLKLYWSSEYIWWNSIPWVSIFIWWGTVFCNVIFVSEINSPSSTWSYFLLLSTSCWTNSWLSVKNLDDRSRTQADSGEKSCLLKERKWEMVLVLVKNGKRGNWFKTKCIFVGFSLIKDNLFPLIFQDF